MTKKRKLAYRDIAKKFTNNQGMTLIEVLLGITILGILAVLMGGVFVNAIGLISRAGDLDSTRNTASKVTENAIAGKTLTPDGGNIKIDTGLISEEVVKDTAVTEQLNKQIVIDFGTTQAAITGDQKKVTSSGIRNNETIEVFIPHD